MVENETFVANSISTGAPVLGSPAVTQQHTIQPNSITTGAPLLGSPVYNASVRRVVSVTANSNNTATLSSNYNKAA